MSERKRLLNSIVKTTADYRITPTSDHVEKWVCQFPDDARLPILREIDHVLERTYFSLSSIEDFLSKLLQSKKLAGENPADFWKGVVFLNIQRGGASQQDMLALLEKPLKKLCGLGVKDCGKGSDVFVYIDDVLCTGNRIRSDLEGWIKSDAPVAAHLHVITIAHHTGGFFYAKEKLEERARASGKKIKMDWWHAIELETTRDQTNNSDVLRPTSLPDDPDVQGYVKGMAYQPVLRKPGQVGARGIFSGEDGRNLLEQQFLVAGAKIRNMCRNLGAVERPLGHMSLDTLGFGSLIVTYRNCPNNAPLVFWVGDPWYPLFPRVTNKQTAVKRFMRMFGQ